MTIIWNPTESLNIAWDASDLPSTGQGNVESSGWNTRCKNLRHNERGKLVTRDGSTKINGSAIETDIWWLEEMDGGTRYTFAGTKIYEDEVAIATGLTSAQWSVIQYNAFNDNTPQLFGVNGTDRKRVVSGAVYEWGIDAPTVAPTLGVGHGEGLTGQFNAKYTYVRKNGTAVVNESNPSPAADVAQVLSGQSLAIDFTEPTDPQVTHIRLYRTQAGGSIYYLDQEVEAAQTYAYGYSHPWEEDNGYISGTGYKFTFTDATRGTENTQSWEATFEDREDTATENPAEPSTPLVDQYEENFRNEGERYVP